MKTITQPSKQFIVRYFASIILVFIKISLFGQCLLPSPKPDNSWPVTNRYNTINDPYSPGTYLVGTGVYNMVSDKGTYYLMGSFTNLVQNQGQALVIDSTTSTVKTQSKWRINGTVLTAIPDGQGGFYIGGEFTRIGDSIRNYIAQIDANGQPTAFNPAADKKVNMMQIRNDTLFIAGDFQNIFSRSKRCLAIYSLKGDSLLPSRLLSFGSINSFLLNRDTLILAGQGISLIKKYSIKDSIQSQWTLPFTEYGPVSMLRFNQDSTTLIYQSEYNDYTIKGFNASTGQLKYKIGAGLFGSTTYGAVIQGMTLAGNKMYAAGYFDAVQLPSGSLVNRKGLYAFDASTGVVLPDKLDIDGYPTFVDYHNGKLYISGSFTKVNAVDRFNFAVLDTGTLAVDPWQLSPSDNIKTLTLYNGTAFISGELNGINAIKRNNFAAIDSATKAVLPWAPSSNILFKESKRMLIKGDTLFVLGNTIGQFSCIINDFVNKLTMFRLSDGKELTTPSLGSNINDIVIDSDYAYVAADNELRRYYLPTFTKDVSWGNWFSSARYNPMYITIRNDTIFAVGDNRYEDGCTSHPPRQGNLVTYSKRTGAWLNYYSYLGTNPNYDIITFEHSLLTDDKLYIQGYFNSLNGKARTGFACINIRTGNLTDWYTPFTQTVSRDDDYRKTSELKLHDGKIWFGAFKFQDNMGNSFPGFGAMDTATGILMPPVADLTYKLYGVPNYLFTSFNNFVFTPNELIGLGTFDYVNGYPVSSISAMPLAARPVYPVSSSIINGPDTIYANNRLNKYFIDGANTNKLSYNWTSDNSNVAFVNNGKDTIRISASTPGTALLSVTAIDYCTAGAIGQKNIVIAAPPPALPVPDVTGLVMQCSFGPNAIAKLTNPPAQAGVSIIILLDGKPVAYKPADSTFNYFISQQTTWGTHTINVKYKYTYATFDSVSKDFSFSVLLPVTPSITITGTTTLKGGDVTTLSATVSNAGTPGYNWQDSTRAHTWQNITGATGQQLRYKPDSTGDKVRCILTSTVFCASPAQVASKPLSFIVTYAVTAINDIDELSKQISLNPNPATSQIIIDTLLLADHWQTLEIMNVDGQRAIPVIPLQNKTSVTVSVLELKNGLYVALLRRKDGKLAVKQFIKQ